jgi:cell wall-associated NlpC family hydrolase
VPRFARPGAVALATLGVLVGTTALTWPADPTATAKTAAVLSNHAPGSTAATPTLTVINTAPKLTANRAAAYRRQPVRLIGTVHYGRTALVKSGLVWLQSWNGKEWRTIETKKLSAKGAVTFTLRPERSTYVRLAVPAQSKSATSWYQSSASPRQLIKVIPRPAPVTARTDAHRSAAAGSYTVASQASGIGARIVAEAARHTGKPYLYGAAGPSRFDCSGFTQYVFKQFGVYLPHNAHAQKSYGRPVSRANARPGDLVFFLSGSHAYHVGIYAGGGYMYDSPRAGRTVGKHRIWSTNIVFQRIA